MSEPYTFYRRAKAIVWVEEEYNVYANSQSQAQDLFLEKFHEGFADPIDQRLCMYEDGEDFEYLGEARFYDCAGNTIHTEG